MYALYSAICGLPMPKIYRAQKIGFCLFGFRLEAPISNKALARPVHQRTKAGKLNESRPASSHPRDLRFWPDSHAPAVPFRHPSAPRADHRAGRHQLAGFRCSENISDIPAAAVRVAPLTTSTAPSAAIAYLPPGDRWERSPAILELAAALES